MCRSRISRAARLIAAVVAVGGLGSTLAGCSDAYWNRRDTIALSAGDAIAGNAAEQTIDPWAPGSGNRNIPFNGQLMQSAVERYRNDKVTQPADPENFISTNQTPQNVTNTTVNTGAPPASTTTPAQ